MIGTCFDSFTMVEATTNASSSTGNNDFLIGLSIVTSFTTVVHAEYVEVVKIIIHIIKVELLVWSIRDMPSTKCTASIGSMSQILTDVGRPMIFG